ncbi:hypothetical protein NPIL_230771 [Nephila pilipes]|uniref:Uncharacterized protein n=1 Tax=Nephila pilipes TaxID=299642 RepID=A0A8X6U143_NEPPI|nr:hypothetical protein NPIL_230771 [Nephila pilipes]
MMLIRKPPASANVCGGVEERHKTTDVSGEGNQSKLLTQNNALAGRHLSPVVSNEKGRGSTSPQNAWPMTAAH